MFMNSNYLITLLAFLTASNAYSKQLDLTIEKQVISYSTSVSIHIAKDQKKLADVDVSDVEFNEFPLQFVIFSNDDQCQISIMKNSYPVGDSELSIKKYFSMYQDVNKKFSKIEKFEQLMCEVKAENIVAVDIKEDPLKYITQLSTTSANCWKFGAGGEAAKRSEVCQNGSCEIELFQNRHAIRYPSLLYTIPNAWERLAKYCKGRK